MGSNPAHVFLVTFIDVACAYGLLPCDSTSLTSNIQYITLTMVKIIHFNCGQSSQKHPFQPWSKQLKTSILTVVKVAILDI